MNPREKIIGLVVGLLVVGFVVYAGVDNLLLSPAAEKDRQIRETQRKISQLKLVNGKKKSYDARMEALAAGTYGMDANAVRQQVQERINRLLDRSGLSEKTHMLTPATGRKIHGAVPVGWSIKRQGKLSHVVNFLYLLSRDPHLHRIENVTVMPKFSEGEVELQVKYLTLVLTPGKGAAHATNQVSTSRPADLNSKQREVHERIVARDLFRPYVKRRQRPRVVYTPPKQADPPPAPKVDPAPAPSPGRFKIVGLPEAGQKQYVLIKDTISGQTKDYKPGDRLSGGVIVMIDYRLLPKPGNAELLSGSRAILKLGPEYWAVELGQTLAQKRRMRPHQLPPKLRPRPKARPAPTSRPARTAKAPG